MKLNKYVSGLILILILSSCQSQNATDRIIKGDLDKVDNELSDVIKPAEDTIKERKMPRAPETVAKRQLPILCYHQISEWTAEDPKSAKDHIPPIDVFKDQIQALADSGYTSILPAQLYNYLVYGDGLPEK